MRACNVEPYEGSEPFIFVSYSHKDSYRVYPIIEYLTKEGYRLWFDAGIEAGSEWLEVIGDHIKRCKTFLAFVSNNSIPSSMCKKEVFLATKYYKDLITVKLEEVELSLGMELQIEPVQYILRYEYEEYEDYRNKFLKIKKLLPCRGISHPNVIVSSEGSEVVEEDSRGEVVRDIDENKITTTSKFYSKKFLLIRTSTGEEIPLTHTEFKIGRNPVMCDYVIRGNTAIGRQHAIFYTKGGFLFIFDNYSKNGVCVNGELIEPGNKYPLDDGDSIWLDKENFILKVGL